MNKALKIVLIILLVVILLIAAAYIAFKVFWDAKASQGAQIGPALTDIPDTQAPEEANVTPEPNAEVVAFDPSASTGEETIGAEEQVDTNIYNILLIGSDKRSWESTATSNGQSDTIMLLSINKGTNTVSMCSFMRDSYIDIRGEKSFYKNKLNAAYAHGGVERLINTLNAERNYDLDIQYYMIVDFEGFISIIDSFGGIYLNLTADECKFINQEVGPDTVEVRDGWMHVGGLVALFYARDRHSASRDGRSGNDAIRTERQQEVIQLVYEKIRSEMTVSSLGTIIGVVRDYTNTNIPHDLLMNLGAYLFTHDISINKITTPPAGTWMYEDVIIAGTGTETPVSVVTFNIDKAREYVHAQLYGEGGKPTATPETDEGAAAEDGAAADDGAEATQAS